MEGSFEIDFGGLKLTVQSLDTVDFVVFEGNKRLAILTPLRDSGKLSWLSRDISQEYAEQIGALISEHEALKWKLDCFRI